MGLKELLEKVRSIELDIEKLGEKRNAIGAEQRKLNIERDGIRGKLDLEKLRDKHPNLKIDTV